ncbi:SH3 domain-containing protein [Azospirillum sp. YIM B02556]|uniref:SH3 domain-containing protein n=1 Tax=Azospirillum endophyticum TaxID=2800326 RepID=A0ABS1FEY7_9PROT|nr:SH3 domain-containing protein [Azospirillum endophyticum]MBK1841989.1 SH3 domain-containing protein [Azospirillum endophyticum]
MTAAPALRRLLPALAAVVLSLAGAVAAPARAQSPVAIGAPLTGEVVLNRDIEVRIGPSEDARIVMTLKQGKALNALGTPRGTYWTEVAIGGQPIGYVPADSLDPALMVTGRPAVGGEGPRSSKPSSPANQPADAPPPHRSAAVVPRAAWDKAAQTPAEGYVVAAGPISATELLTNRKRRGFTLRKGDVVALIGAANGEATLALPAGTRALAPVQGLVGVVAPYPLPGMPPVEPGMLYGIKLGEYVSYAEGLRAWKEFTAGPGSAYRDLPPMVWPVFRKGRLLYEVGVAPFSRLQVDTACGTLAQRGLDCTVIELDTF